MKPTPKAAAERPAIPYSRPHGTAWGWLLAGCLLAGCAEERTLSDDPAEIEKRRQEHVQTMQREMEEAGGR